MNDNFEKDKDSLIAKSSFPFSVLAVIIFFLLGFIWGLWHIAWLVFLTIPIANYFAKKQEEKKRSRDKSE